MSDEGQNEESGQDYEIQALVFAMEYAHWAAENQNQPLPLRPHLPRNIGQLLMVAREIRGFLYGEDEE